MQKRFVDLSFGEMEALVIAQDPSLDSVLCRCRDHSQTLLMLIGRAHIHLTHRGKAPTSLVPVIRMLQGDLSYLIHFLDEEILNIKKASVGAEAQT
jgi:hypothetical protein